MGYQRIVEGHSAREPNPEAATTVINSMQVGIEALEALQYTGQEVFSYPSTLPTTGTPLAIGLPVYNDSQYPWTIKSVRASLGTGPTTSDVVIDIRYHATTPGSATTIFNTKPTLTVGGSTTNKVTSLAQSTIASGGVLLLDLYGLDSGGGAKDLVVQIDYEY
jgi:hypothetical protein